MPGSLKLCLPCSQSLLLLALFCALLLLCLWDGPKGGGERLRQRHRRGDIHQPSCFRLPSLPFIPPHTHSPILYTHIPHAKYSVPLMSKRPRAEEHANGGGGGRQEHHHRGGGGYGHGGGGRGRGGGRGGGNKMPHLSAAAEEKRQGMRVQEMETLRKRAVEEAPAPGTYYTRT